jgi:predicted DsbA family dithiol-disulfide isomerase
MIAAAAPPRVSIVEVFADIWCPFTHVGLRRLVEQRERLGRDDVVMRVRAWPLELVNGAPLTGAFVGEEIEALRATVARDLFLGFDSAHFPRTTGPALALAACAYRRGDHVGEAVSLALRTALFEQGRDIAEPSELAGIAANYELELPSPDDVRSVHDDWREGQRRGVIGSPHFFVAGHAFFCPSLNIDRVDDQLQVTVDRDAFSQFAATVFTDDEREQARSPSTAASREPPPR